MRITAYLLLGDPTWIRTSVLAYYPHVDRIVASYDRDARGWAGGTLDLGPCLEALRAIDTDGKVEFLPGRHRYPGVDALGCETRQRQQALDAAGRDADWVLQLDSDEVLPDVDALRRVLATADSLGVPAVEWPMRVLYRRLRDGRFLEIAEEGGGLHVEYPGAVAVRGGTRLAHCRRVDGPFVRAVPEGPPAGIEIRRAPAPQEHRVPVDAAGAIWHDSWARPTASVVRKLATWGHSAGPRSAVYLARVWWPAPVSHRRVRNLHPFSRSLWPELRLAPEPPFTVHPDDELREAGLPRASPVDLVRLLAPVRRARATA